MATECACKACGSNAGVHWQTRCDACGIIFEPWPTTTLTLPGRVNASDLCPECKARALAAVDGILLKCARCGHLRSEHNTCCMRVEDHKTCGCTEWVAP